VQVEAGLMKKSKFNSINQ